jgi:hypothetical protein
MGSIPIAAIGFAAVAAVVIVAIRARRGFLRRIRTLQRSLERSPPTSGVRTDLPSEVIALSRRLGGRGDEGRRIVRLSQSGEMWLKPGSKPITFTARQSIAVADVGFLWRPRFRMAGVSLQIIDYLVGGEGGLEGRLLGALRVLRPTGGDAVYRGEAMRYLAELMWAPDAVLGNRQLDWRVVDRGTLAVATGAGPRRSEVRLILDKAGDPVRAEADDRPRLDAGVITPSAWFGRGADFHVVNGRRIPTRGEAGWIVDGVEFIYWRCRINSWSLEP